MKFDIWNKRRKHRTGPTWLLLSILTLTGCGNTKTAPPKSTDIPDNAGLYVMGDADKMAGFLGVKSKKDIAGYCLDYKPQIGKAYARFFFLEGAYEMDVVKSSSDRYRLIFQDRMRDFDIEKDSDSPHFYWHFSDSNPYTPQSDTGNRDGTRDNRYTSLQECVSAQEQEYMDTPADIDGVFERTKSSPRQGK
jgi:hypothetical protein